MAASTPVLMIIFVFAFVPLVLAEVARKKAVPTVANFFLQDRKMPAPMVFFTVYGTWVSSFAVLGSASSFYSNGPVYLTAFAWNALFGILFLLLGKRLWFYGKTRNYVTPADFFEDIFESRFLSMLIVFVMLIFTVPYLQIQLYGGAYLIEVATNGMIPWRIGGLLFYLIIIIYLWAGGMRAVALTDIFYGILIFIAMLITGFYLASKAGGVEAIFQAIADTAPEKLVLSNVEPGRGIFSWFSLFLIVPLGAIMGPPLWLRAYSVGNPKTFHLMPFLITFAAIMYLGSILSGSAGLILLPYVERTDTLIPSMLILCGNNLLSALLFCGIASAALSTANSQIHAIAAIYTIDIHKKYFNQNASEKKLVDIGKWAVLLISALAYLLMSQTPGLLMDTGTIGLAGTAQIIVPTIGALFWKRSHCNAAAAGVLAGILILMALIVFTNLNAAYCGVIALFSNTAIFILGSRILKPTGKTREKIVSYRDACEKEM